MMDPPSQHEAQGVLDVGRGGGQEMSSEGFNKLNSPICTKLFDKVDNETLSEVIEYLKDNGVKIEDGKLIEPVNCGELLLIALPQQVFSELANVLTKDATCTWQVNDKCLGLVDAGVVEAFNLHHEPVELTCQNPPCSARILTPEWFLYDSLKLTKVGDYYVICYNGACVRTDEPGLHGALGRLDVPRNIAIKVEDDVLTNAPWGIEIGRFSDGFNEYPVFKTKDRLYIRWVRYVEKDGEPVEDVREGTIYNGPLDALVVRDELTNMQYYILRTPYGTYVGFNPGETIETMLAEHDPGIANTRRQWVERGLELLFRRSLDGGVVDTSVYTGPYPDGWRDGFIEYPVVTWDCDPTVLEELIKFILDNYELNRRQALANVGLFLGSVYAPALKFHWGVFENRIVVNTGPRWVGKTTTMLAIMNALGIKGRFFSTDESTRTPQRLRNILAYNMAPAVFNDVDVGTFEALRNYGLASTTDATITGVQASTAGRGFREVFIAVSNVLITTNLTIGEIANALSGGRGRRDAWLRRVLPITWEAQRLRPGVHAPRFDDHSGRLIGCLRQLWGDDSVRRDLLDSNDLLELSAKTTKYFFNRYGVEVTPIIEALVFVKNAQEKVVNAIEATTTPERRAIQRMIEITRQLGQPVDAFSILTALINNPTAFDAKPSPPKQQVNMSELEDLVRALGRDPSKYPLNPDDKKTADRIDLLLDTLFNLYQRGTARVILFANSPYGVVDGTPRKLFNAVHSNYRDLNNNEREGYSVSLVELTKQLLAVAPEEAQEEQAQEGREGGNNQ
jgi:hypothetical protein